jgi:hypothetical protein
MSGIFSVNCVERRGILVSGASDAHESRASHCNRLRFIAKGVRRLLLIENTHISRGDVLRLKNLSKLWTCMKFYECAFDPALMSKTEMIVHDPKLS